MDLKDKVVVITGSSSGIGKTTALAFAKEGAKIVVNYNVNKEGAEETLSEIQKLGVEALLVQADVSKPNDVKRLFEEVEKKFGTLHILINNAGITTDKTPFMESNFDDFEELIHTNLLGPMLCSQIAIPYMQSQGFGKILNTSSIRGIEYGGRTIAYSASKAALNSFTKTLAKQVAPVIHVNAVAPGFIQNEAHAHITDEELAKYLNDTYLKRAVKEEEIADAFLFLAKNDAMTGQVIYVDAGFTLK
jgi:NAD(P)-dependent dehydrogenase (short-subunit alcohol dehydrogenase family)